MVGNLKIAGLWQGRGLGRQDQKGESPRELPREYNTTSKIGSLASFMGVTQPSPQAAHPSFQLYTIYFLLATGQFNLGDLQVPRYHIHEINIVSKRQLQ